MPPTPLRGATAAAPKGKHRTRLDTPKTRHAASQHPNAQRAHHHKDGNITSNQQGMSPQTSDFCPPAKRSVWLGASSSQDSPEGICWYGLALFSGSRSPQHPLVSCCGGGSAGRHGRKHSFSKWQQLLITRGLFSFPPPRTAASEVKSVFAHQNINGRDRNEEGEVKAIFTLHC